MVTVDREFTTGQRHAMTPLLCHTGALKALVKLVEAAVAGHKASASEPFHAEILEHVAELQRSDPAVRAALAEVGGLEELLGLIEEGTKGVKRVDRVTDKDTQLVVVQVSLCPISCVRCWLLKSACPAIRWRRSSQCCRVSDLFESLFRAA